MSHLETHVSLARLANGVALVHLVATSWPNTKSRFWSNKNLNFEAKIKLWGFSISLNWNFWVSQWDSRGIEKIDFGFLKMDSKILNPKFEIEIMVLGCEILIFGEQFSNRNFGKMEIPKFQNLAELLSHFVFVFNFSMKFLIFRVYISIYTIFLNFRLPVRNFLLQVHAWWRKWMWLVSLSLESDRNYFNQLRRLKVQILIAIWNKIVKWRMIFKIKLAKKLIDQKKKWKNFKIKIKFFKLFFWKTYRRDGLGNEFGLNVCLLDQHHPSRAYFFFRLYIRYHRKLFIMKKMSIDLCHCDI